MGPRSIRRWFHVLIMLLVWCVILYNSLQYRHTRYCDCINHVVKLPPTNKPNTDRKKRIVWFDREHNGHGLRNSVNYARFHRCKGVARNCEILPHRLIKGSVLESHYHPKGDNIDYNTVEPIKADAVIFQACHLPMLSALKRLDNDQVFVLAERENWWAGGAYNKFYETKNRNALYYVNKFNWTMTYRYDSDIIFPYGYIIPKSKFKDTKNYRSIYKNKRFEVAWLVSHCSTGSRREQYVNRLKKYISVHIYGACGSLRCPKGNRACLNHIIKTYKFVLSFENTYHTNYVTEKLFNWFPQLIVPVVRGGETNYTRHGVPAGTIINADAFENPEALAMYLKRIGSDEEKYTTMLKMKAGFEVISKRDIQKQGYCKLCEMLNTLDDNRQYYNHIGGWFASKQDSKIFC